MENNLLLNEKEDEFKLLDTSYFNGLLDCPTEAICNMAIIASSKLKRYERIVVCVSGGKDSDFGVDLISSLEKDLKSKDGKIFYVNVNPGLEHNSVKEHLSELEDIYGIKIIRLSPKETVSTVCRKWGQPFCSKQAAEYISRLQSHGFDFEEHYEDSFEDLWELYPNCKSALEWWTNTKGENSRLNISWNKGLKEFMSTYPPYFKISKMCCVKSKEETMDSFAKEIGADLQCNFIRKGEGGARSVAFSNCFTDNDGAADEYRPLFFLKKKDLQEYEKVRPLKHSDFYLSKEEGGYGLNRSGCSCCPFGMNCLDELDTCREKEPGLYKVVSNVFRDSITYTKMYRMFKQTGIVSNELVREYEANKSSYTARTSTRIRQLSLFEKLDLAQ